MECYTIAEKFVILQVILLIFYEIFKVNIFNFIIFTKN